LGAAGGGYGLSLPLTSHHEDTKTRRKTNGNRKPSWQTACGVVIRSGLPFFVPSCLRGERFE
jgi:hypothetical protein